eukprot:4481655-Karenia_brevis.AAC.1
MACRNRLDEIGAAAKYHCCWPVGFRLVGHLRSSRGCSVAKEWAFGIVSSVVPRIVRCTSVAAAG